MEVVCGSCLGCEGDFDGLVGMEVVGVGGGEECFDEEDEFGVVFVVVEDGWCVFGCW